MKNYLVIFPPLLLAWFVACEQHHEPNVYTGEGRQGNISAEVTQNVSRPGINPSSGTDFEKALVALRNNQPDQALYFLESGITSFREETRNSQGDARQRAVQTAQTLDQLKSQLQAGTVKSSAAFKEQFLRAELLTAYHYLILSRNYRAEHHLNSPIIQLKATISALRQAAQFGDAMFKGNAEPYIRETDALIKGLEQGEPLRRQQINVQNDSLICFLERVTR